MRIAGCFSPQSQLDGDIAELRVWDRVLSEVRPACYAKVHLSAQLKWLHYLLWPAIRPACGALQTEVRAEKWSKGPASTRGLVLAYDFSPGKLQGEPGSQVAASSWMNIRGMGRTPAQSPRPSSGQSTCWCNTVLTCHAMAVTVGRRWR